VQALAAAQKIFVRFGGRLPAPYGTSLALGERAASQCLCDSLSDLVLDVKHVTNMPVKALRPSVISAVDINELNRDAKAIARLTHASVQQGADPEAPAHFANIHSGAAELKR
jgi:hypothetical protein